MKKYKWHILIPVVLLLLGYQIYKELTNSYIIVWDENKKITWNDFTSTKELPKNISATIFSNIKCDIYSLDKRIEVYAYMDKTKSKKLENFDLNEEMLKHEQYHFNITEYFARLLRKDLIAIGTNNISEKTIKKVLEKHHTNLFKMQRSYDSLTKHGEGIIQQPLWEIKIDTLLKKYSKYKNKELYSYDSFYK